jgi:formylglycine-generating enzyme required for sulfatase activity
MGCGFCVIGSSSLARVLGRERGQAARTFTAVLLLAVGFSPSSALAQSSIPLSPTAQASGARITVDKGLEFVTIGSPGNPAWQGTTPPTPGDRAIGRGSVSYEYKIGRFEVTTAQWAEFMTAALDRPVSDRIPFVGAPSRWGAQATTGLNGGTRFVVPAGKEMLPAGNISWRTAALYCNWLSNDKRTDRAAFMSGAYDVSTFSTTGGGRFTDQLTRSPGAKFWIPSWDEWLKAAHFDPNKNGAGQADYWQFSITSDAVPAYGPPGQRTTLVNGQPQPSPSSAVAQVNAGWNTQSFPGFDPFTVPLGAYPAVQSPWGLLDVAGATSEWTEEVFRTADGFPADRYFVGSAWTGSLVNGFGNVIADRVGFTQGGDSPSLNTFDLGFRVAALVPSPSVCWVGAGLCLFSMQRWRRTHEKVQGRSRAALDDLCQPSAGRGQVHD